jgi:hypothetical protein
MSRFDDTLEQLKAVATNLGHKIQESALYIQLQDRYQTYSPSTQKLVRMGGVFAIIFILILQPMILFLNSQETISAFEEKRNLVRELFKTYREASSRPDISIPPAIEILRSSIDSVISLANLTPEQKLGVIKSSVEGKIIPENLVTHVFEVKLAKLNIKQIVDIGAGLVGISDSVKMKDLNITPHNTDVGYFDVTYKLYSLNVPAPTPEATPEPEPKPKKGSSKKTDTQNGGDE